MALGKRRTIVASTPTASTSTVDAFLWNHLAAPEGPVALPRVPRPEIDRPAIERPAVDFMDVIDITPVREHEHAVPAGMFGHWPLDVLLNIDKPFTGLVVLIDIVTSRRGLGPNERVLESITALVAGLLGDGDFGCRTNENEFVIVYGGAQGAEAQRKLNYISERLWEHQQRHHGAFSLLFSWGGLGAAGRPLAEAMASAVHRMNHMNRNRNVISMRSVNQNRKTV
jgi:hypothetical protein